MCAYFCCSPNLNLLSRSINAHLISGVHCVTCTRHRHVLEALQRATHWPSESAGIYLYGANSKTVILLHRQRCRHSNKRSRRLFATKAATNALHTDDKAMSWYSQHVANVRLNLASFNAVSNDNAPALVKHSVNW